MKKIILIAGSLLYSAIAFAQDIQTAEVPSVVLNTFKQKFPKATDVEWKLKDQLYNVEFEIGRIDHEAWLTTTGIIVKHKQDIEASELPKEVSAVINRNYKGYRIDDVEKIEAGEKLLYKAELKTMVKEEEVTFDQNGKLVRQH